MNHDDYEEFDKYYDHDDHKKLCAKCGATNYASALICAEGCGSDEFEEKGVESNEKKHSKNRN